MTKKTAEKPIWENFPAKFHDDILSTIDSLLKPGWKVLDPFAGTGRIHELRPRVQTYGVDIEIEAVNMSRHTRLGDATKLPARWTGFFDAVATSPSYANRMADKHDAKEKCKKCMGTGVVEAKIKLAKSPRGIDLVCEKCNGKGVRKYKRITYKHTLGHDLHPNNSGGMQWGPAYRELHEKAWAEAYRVLRKGGLLIVNCKNHVRGKKEIDVVGWHADTILSLGFKEVERIPVKTSGMGYGQNRDARAECEWVLVFRKPGRP